MPLDRLNPRSHRTDLRLQRNRSSSSRRGSDRHLRLWDAIQRTRKELAQWQAQLDHVEGLFRSVILPREKQLTERFCTLTHALIDRFAPNDLSAAEQSLLGLWITENLHTLNTHPFATPATLQILTIRWEETLNRDAPAENQLRRLAEQRGLFTNERPSGIGPADSPDINETPKEQTSAKGVEDSTEEDIVFDFGWHAKTPASDAPKSPRQDEPPEPADPVRERAATDKGQDSLSQEELDSKIRHLQEGLSVERLFRRLARVLHPDREPDETRKQEKHVLMSQCLKARDDNDIDTLLTYYCEYVGQLPDDIGDDSHDQLVRALEQQLTLLQTELRQRRFADPLQRQIVDRYDALSEEGRQHHIEQHARNLDIEIEQVKRDYQSLLQSDGLQRALSVRRDIELNRLAINEMTGLS